VRGLVTALVQRDANFKTATILGFDDALYQSGDKSPHSKEAPLVEHRQLTPPPQTVDLLSKLFDFGLLNH